MDNAVPAWELPGRMRTALLAALLGMALVLAVRAAGASEARAAVDQANAALAAQPPRIGEARMALLRATAIADDPPAVAEAYFQLGKLDEELGRYGEALEEDEAAVEAAGNTRWALRARDRADWLRARSEGNFGPLARLERVRRDPATGADPAAISALATDLESFPPGLVRVEARMLVAEAWLGRMHRPEDAIGQLRSVTNDPKADPLTLRLAERELVDALVATGRLDDAAAEAQSHAARLDPRFVKQVGRLIVRREVRYGSRAVLVAFALLAVVALWRAGARGALGAAKTELRKLAPVAIPFVAFLAIGGGLLASKYESGNASPFVWLGAIVLPLLLVARAWAAVGAQTGRARAARAALCGGAVVAAAFTLLDVLDPQYLTGFGL
jgi:tetratricopeptide (TPR) repeat protein